jgi:hypothetical protein
MRVRRFVVGDRLADLLSGLFVHCAHLKLRWAFYHKKMPCCEITAEAA